MDKKDFWDDTYKPWGTPDDPPIYHAALVLKDGRMYRYESSLGKRYYWTSIDHIKTSLRVKRNMLVGNLWTWTTPLRHPDVEYAVVFDSKGHSVEVIRR